METTEQAEYIVSNILEEAIYKSLTIMTEDEGINSCSNTVNGVSDFRHSKSWNLLPPWTQEKMKQAFPKDVKSVAINIVDNLISNLPQRSTCNDGDPSPGEAKDMKKNGPYISNVILEENGSLNVIEPCQYVIIPGEKVSAESKVPEKILLGESTSLVPSELSFLSMKTEPESVITLNETYYDVFSTSDECFVTWGKSNGSSRADVSNMNPISIANKGVHSVQNLDGEENDIRSDPIQDGSLNIEACVKSEPEGVQMIGKPTSDETLETSHSFDASQIMENNPEAVLKVQIYNQVSDENMTATMVQEAVKTDGTVVVETYRFVKNGLAAEEDRKESLLSHVIQKECLAGDDNTCTKPALLTVSVGYPTEEDSVTYLNGGNSAYEWMRKYEDRSNQYRYCTYKRTSGELTFTNPRPGEKILNVETRRLEGVEMVPEVGKPPSATNSEKSFSSDPVESVDFFEDQFSQGRPEEAKEPLREVSKQVLSTDKPAVTENIPVAKSGPSAEKLVEKKCTKQSKTVPTTENIEVVKELPIANNILQTASALETLLEVSVEKTIQVPLSGKLSCANCRVQSKISSSNEKLSFVEELLPPDSILPTISVQETIKFPFSEKSGVTEELLTAESKMLPLTKEPLTTSDKLHSTEMVHREGSLQDIIEVLSEVTVADSKMPKCEVPEKLSDVGLEHSGMTQSTVQIQERVILQETATFLLRERQDTRENLSTSEKGHLEPKKFIASEKQNLPEKLVLSESDKKQPIIKPKEESLEDYGKLYKAKRVQLSGAKLPLKNLGPTEELLPQAKKLKMNSTENNSLSIGCGISFDNSADGKNLSNQTSVGVTDNHISEDEEVQKPTESYQEKVQTVITSYIENPDKPEYCDMGLSFAETDLYTHVPAILKDATVMTGTQGIVSTTRKSGTVSKGSETVGSKKGDSFPGKDGPATVVPEHGLPEGGDVGGAGVVPEAQKIQKKKSLLHRMFHPLGRLFKPNKQ